jgi:hypothetical protein
MIRSIEITPDVHDFSEVAETFVMGIAKIERIGNGVVRVSLRILWDAQTYFSCTVAEAFAGKYRNEDLAWDAPTLPASLPRVRPPVGADHAALGADHVPA